MVDEGKLEVRGGIGELAGGAPGWWAESEIVSDLRGKGPRVL